MKSVAYKILDLRGAEGALFNTKALACSIQSTALGLNDPASAFVYMVPQDPSAEQTDEALVVFRRSRDRLNCYLGFIDAMVNMTKARVQIEFDPSGLDQEHRELIAEMVQHSVDLLKGSSPLSSVDYTFDTEALTLKAMRSDDDGTDPEPEVDEDQDATELPAEAADEAGIQPMPAQ